MKDYKKWLVLSFALLITVFTVACSSDKDKNSTDDMANNPATEHSTSTNNGPGTGGNSTVVDDVGNGLVDDVGEVVSDAVDEVKDGVDIITNTP